MCTNVNTYKKIQVLFTHALPRKNYSIWQTRINVRQNQCTLNSKQSGKSLLCKHRCKDSVNLQNVKVYVKANYDFRFRCRMER